MVNIRTFIIFLLDVFMIHLYILYVNKTIYHTFKLKFIDKIMIYQKKSCIL